MRNICTIIPHAGYIKQLSNSNFGKSLNVIHKTIESRKGQCIRSHDMLLGYEADDF